MDLIDGAVRRREFELRVGEDWIGRVVGFAGLEVEEAIASFVLTGEPGQKTEETSDKAELLHGRVQHRTDNIESRVVEDLSSPCGKC